MAMPAAPNIQYIQALVTSITVTAAGQADSVKVGSTLQMNAEVHMDTAANKNVVWSVVNEDGSSTTLAAIGTDGLLHATAEGKVTVVATAADGSGVKGEKKLPCLQIQSFHLAQHRHQLQVQVQHRIHRLVVQRQLQRLLAIK